jgi:hypothetical protein
MSMILLEPAYKILHTTVKFKRRTISVTPFYVRIAKFGSWVGEIVSEVGDHAPGTWNQCNSIHCAESRFTWVKR